ncbi:Na+/H+ antiporter subunit E [Alkalimonas mucilaginosa]|uniref:Na+/H+ antiporter subunit E n=1 Tax=Alkalimonas mucilaginosa TaxID=3057676 RepID=A0ABU7JCC5_9GAMM|nr:Na+/H+ antiporter subunit E [Alkalimonas sp. MEB004]MEE2023342.1 Na+/H+ antiporter subunit E [Alkalimonas sp. MEB004]
MQPASAQPASSALASRLQRLACRAVLYALLWFVLGGGEGWWFFAMILPLLLWLSERWPAPLLRLRWRHLPAFTGYFLIEMWRGGFDVAWRALQPISAITPNWQRYPVRLQQTSSQRMLACLISLLPGTTVCRSCLSGESRVETAWLELHLLTDNNDWQQSVARLEQRLSLLLAAEQPLC